MDYRTLVKAYGLRFIIEVVGEGRRFHIIPLLVTVGSGVGLLAIVSLCVDCGPILEREKGESLNLFVSFRGKIIGISRHYL